LLIVFYQDKSGISNTIPPNDRDDAGSSEGDTPLRRAERLFAKVDTNLNRQQQILDQNAVNSGDDTSVHSFVPLAQRAFPKLKLGCHLRSRETMLSPHAQMSVSSAFQVEAVFHAADTNATHFYAASAPSRPDRTTLWFVIVVMVIFILLPAAGIVYKFVIATDELERNGHIV
jgi:hypothetical protein